MSVQPEPRKLKLAKPMAMALMLIMMAPTFAAPVEAVLNYTSDEQDAQIRADWGPGAPFGTWRKANEPAKFYFHGLDGCGDLSVPALTTTCAPSPVGAPATPPGQATWWLDTRTPRNDCPPVTVACKAPQEVTLQAVDSTSGAGPLVGGNTLDFDNFNCFVNNLQVLDETTISAFDGRMWMRGNRVDQSRLRLYVSVLNSDCTVKTVNAAEFDLATSVPDQTGSQVFNPGYARFDGTWTFPFVDPTQPYGIVIQKGERIRVSVGLVCDDAATIFCDGDATVAFDGWGFESYFTIHSDSARLNQWTANRFNEVTNHFPHTSAQSPADVNDRTIHWSATEFNTWGHMDTNTPATPPPPATQLDPGSPCNLTAGSADYREFAAGNCAKDNLDEMKMRLRVKDMTPGHAGYDQYVPLDLRLGLTVWDSSVGQDTSFVGCCDATFINPIQSRGPTNQLTDDVDRKLGIANYQFRIVYAKDFLDGVYQIEFQESSKLWVFATQFVVGNTGFDFNFDDEHIVTIDGTTVDHRVALNEPTKYSLLVTNSGSVSDTFGLAIPVPGSGWTASVTPTHVTLPPGGEAKVDMLVIPPTTARAGDFKVVSVVATSTVTNDIKTLYTRTTYTADTTPEAPYLWSPQDEVNTRPGLATNFPLIVYNGHPDADVVGGWKHGPVRDNYVITSTMDPGNLACPSEGFVVTINPTFLPVFAASREAVTVRVQAPAEAPPECSWTLHFKACRSVNDGAAALCSPELVIPIKIYAIDDVKVSVLKQQIDMRDGELDQYHVSCPGRAPGGGPGVGGGGPGAPCTYVADDQDTFFDDGSLFRFLVENRGDRPDSIELSGSWAPCRPGSCAQNQGWEDRGDCEVGTSGSVYGDGVPDGWRYRLLGGSPATAPMGPPSDPGMTYPQPPGAGPALGPRFTRDITVWDGTPLSTGLMPDTGAQYGAGHDANFAGEARFGRLTLPAHTSQYVFVELSWTPPFSSDNDNNSNPFNTGCEGVQVVDVPAGEAGATGVACTAFITGSCAVPQSYRYSAPSPWATFRFSYRSGNDDSIRGNLDVTARLTNRDDQVDTEGNDRDGMRHKVLIELGPEQPVIGFANIDALDSSATYNMIATNLGNEYDDLLLNVDNGQNGWKHTIVPLPNLGKGDAIQSTGILPSGDGGAGITQPTPFPPSGPGTPRANRDCRITDAGSQQMTCHSIGVHDAVYFQVKAKPPTGAAVGAYDDMAIVVSSSRATLMSPPPAAGGVDDKITVRSFVQGVFGFALLHPNDSLLGYRGQTIAFPYTIKNVGTTNDLYNVAVAEADSAFYNAWNPKVSSSQYVAVPAGYEFHGFVSVTVPSDPLLAEITDPRLVQPAPAIRPLRLEIQSLQGFGQSGVLDFFPVVTEEPPLKLSAEAATIAHSTLQDLAGGRIRITADAPDYQTVLFNGYYQSEPSSVGVGGQPDLPFGFKFMCLPSTHPDYDVNRKCYTPYPPQNEVQCQNCNVPHIVLPQVDSGGRAIQQLEVFVPAKQLGTSRVALRIQGIGDDCDLILPENPNDCGFTFTDAIINMASVYGVELTAVPRIGEPASSNPARKFVPPGTPGGSVAAGGTVLFDVDVANTGLSPQSVLLSNSDLPDGWQLFYNTVSLTVQPPGYLLAKGVEDCTTLGEPACLPLDPVTTNRIEIGIVAPLDAEPGDTASVLIFGTVQEDTTQVAQLLLEAVVGEYDMIVTAAPPVEWVAPQERGIYPVTLQNVGDLQDVVQLQAILPSTVADTFPTQWEDCDNNDPLMPPVPQPAVGDLPSCYLILEPDESKTVRVFIQTPGQVAPTGSGPGYTATISAHSVYRPASAATTAVTLKILNYELYDVDGDQAYEYAVDSCTVSQYDGCKPNASDGFETFRENLQGAGIVTQSLRGSFELEQFLSPQGRADWTDSDGVLTYQVDVDFDARVDHLLDTTSDGMPDVVWVPGKIVQKLTFTRDVTADQLPDYFIDLEGGTEWDVVFDLALGRAFRLIPTFVDGDGYPDFIVDLNMNGVIDLNDTILFGGPNGALRRIEYSADVNGDGLMDKAVDTNGDGAPDFWIPANADGTISSSIAIILKDVTGDGVPDWTYDHTGKGGRPDQYYDPVTKEAHAIDSRGEFLRDIMQYWFILLLFGLAMVLFVVLVVVTRKR